jgi:hypothetical protein
MYIDTDGNDAFKRRFWEADNFHCGIAYVYVMPPGAIMGDPVPNALSTREYMKRDGSYLALPGLRPANYARFSGGLGRVYSTANGLAGFVDTGGNVVIMPQFWAASDFSEGLCRVSIQARSINGEKDENKDILSGFINTKGKLVIPYRHYLEVGDFSEGLAYVKEKMSDGKIVTGFINTRGEYAIICDYEVIEVNEERVFQNGFFSARIKRKGDNKAHDVMIDHNGCTVAPPKGSRFMVFYALDPFLY